MRALDSGVLLAYLEGSAKARELVRKLRGTELATTEGNLLELALVAAAAPSKQRTARLEALDRLRPRLTVLPLEHRAFREAAKGLASSGDAPGLATTAMMGTLQAAGCEELLTDDPASIRGSWRVKVRKVAV